MKHRIRIMRNENGVLVFDRYATPYEMESLRVNVDGKVERLRLSIHKSMQDGEFVAVNVDLENHRRINIYGLYEDVSTTHFVEWGECLTSFPVYENDIILIHDGDGICYEVRDGIFPLMDFYTNYLVNGSQYCEVEIIGNVWQNPELLEAK